MFSDFLKQPRTKTLMYRKFSESTLRELGQTLSNGYKNNSR